MKVTVVNRGAVRNVSGLRLVLQAETQAESALLKMASVEYGESSAVYGPDILNAAKLDIAFNVS